MPGELVFSTTADDASSPTERMRIDSSGNVSITNTPTTNTSKLFIRANQGTNRGKWSDCCIALYNGTGSSEYSQMGLGYTLGTYAPAYIGYINTSSSSFGLGSLVFGTRSVVTDTQPTERMRIDDSGRLFLYNITGNASSGSTLKYSSGDDEVRYDTSSQLLKTNIADLTKGIDTVKKLRPISFTPQSYNKDGSITVDDGDNCIGFLADEMVNEVPEIVQMYPKKTLTKQEEDTELVPAAISYDKLTPVLTKAIQELIAEVDTLKAKVAALEGS
jgi:hypothetical protein